MNLDVAAERASLTPDRQALWWRGRWLTYLELNARAESLAVALHRTGVRKGDRVSILAFNHLAHIDLILATAKLGFIYTPLNYRLSVREQQQIIDDLRPKVLLFDAENEAAVAPRDSASESSSADGHGQPRASIHLNAYESWLAHAPAGGSQGHGGTTRDGTATAGIPAPDRDPDPDVDPDLDPEDTQMILLTGGTTGLPKGAMQPYRQGVFNAVNTVLSWGLRHDDCVIQATPCFHAAVNAFTVPLFHHGAKVVLMESFEPGAYLDLVEATGATILFMVPTMYKMLADHERFETTDLSGVRWAISGGAPCPDPVREAFAARGVRFKQGYGLTEAGVNCFAIELDDAEERPGSVGKPVLHGRACIRRPDGVPAEPGEVGELTLSGPHVFTGYFERPDATAEALRDGWLWTGDLATVDEDGFYTIVGRSKEMFISGGENVYPVEIENALYDHPAVGECAVVGVPDDRWGEVGLAVIVPKTSELGADDVRKHLRAHVASYKVPKHIRFASSLPKSGAGKILKNVLADDFRADDGATQQRDAHEPSGAGRA